jgi:hypothetical protein
MVLGRTTENYNNPFFVSLSTIEWGGERGRLSMAAAAAHEAPPRDVRRLLERGVEASMDDSNWTYELDIYNLGNPVSVRKYDELKSRISTQASTTCQGIVNPTYVKERFGVNDFLFVLNLRTGKERSVPGPKAFTKEVTGFSLVLMLRH